jgi:hypothetical protein
MNDFNQSQNEKEIDSLKFTQLEDGQYEVEWDRNDPNWSFLNNFTSEQIKLIIQNAMRQYHD